MKVVYNPKKFGLNLTRAEMELICERKGNGWHIIGPKKGGSNAAWFYERTSSNSGLRIDWMEFRSDPLLLAMVEAGELSNKDLVITEVNGDYYIDTDWETWETVKEVSYDTN